MMAVFSFPQSIYKQNVAELECLLFGVGQDGDGVCLQVRLGPYTVLLDCGLTDLSSLSRAVEEVAWSALICSHAHPDHGRGIQGLHAIAPDLSIYASEATAHLLPLAWSEALLAPTELCIPLKWGIPRQIQPNLFVTLLPSGHLPGAASIWLSYTARDRNYTVLYTGDFFLSNSRLVEGLPLDEFRGLAPDVLIIEGTFGTAKHPHRRNQENNLANQISEAIAKGQSVLLPLPKLGISQEILMLLRSHHRFTGKDIDIWVDAEIALGCDLYLDLLPWLPTSVQNFAQHQPLFWDQRVRPRVQRLETVPEFALIQRLARLDQDFSAQVNPQIPVEPSIFMVDRNTNWKTWLNDCVCPWLVLLPEDHADRMFAEQAAVSIPKGIAALNFPYQTYLLAEHSDVSGTTQLIHNLKPQHVVFVHGDRHYLSDLANLDELRNRYHIHCPSVGKRLELPVGESLHFIALQESEENHPFHLYEGELAELDSAVMLTLPAEITNDPRWLSFADTGLIEARWQGGDLLIHGIKQRELLAADAENAASYNLRSCANCRFYQGQRCHNSESPLHNMKISSDGYCPAFEST